MQMRLVLVVATLSSAAMLLPVMSLLYNALTRARSEVQTGS